MDNFTPTKSNFSAIKTFNGSTVIPDYISGIGRLDNYLLGILRMLVDALDDEQRVELIVGQMDCFTRDFSLDDTGSDNDDRAIETLNTWKTLLEKKRFGQ